MKNITFFSPKNHHFYSREISQYIAWACLRNGGSLFGITSLYRVMPVSDPRDRFIQQKRYGACLMIFDDNSKIFLSKVYKKPMLWVLIRIAWTRRF